MGNIKDVIDLLTQLANRVEDRQVAIELNEIQRLIIGLQSEQADLHETNVKLREELFEVKTENNRLSVEIAQNDAWKDQIDKYELITTEGGATVYQYKSDPVHYACPSCMSKREIQILQNQRTYTGRFICPGCSVAFPVNVVQKRPKPKVIRSLRSSRY